MSQTQDTIVAALMEQLIAEGPDGMAQVFTTLFNLAMRLERERFLGAGLYERNPDRRGYANGYKSKTLDTTAGTVTVDVPKAAGIDEPFYPRSLERGRRSSRAVMLAIAEMYVQGVSTRDAAKVMAEFGLKSLSSTQVSRAAALLDEELAAWRRRPLGEIQEYREFRVWAMTMETEETSYGTTQTASYSRSIAGSAVGRDGRQGGLCQGRPAG